MMRIGWGTAGNGLNRVWIAFLLVLGTVLPATAQQQARQLGRFGLNTLADFLPTLVYQCFDDVGTRPGGDARGMGGAYLAQASGPMAVGWNPAGLASLEHTGIAIDGYTSGSRSTVGSYPTTLSIPNFQTLSATSYRSDLKGSTRANLFSAGTPLFRHGAWRIVGAFSWRRFYDLTQPEDAVLDLVQGGAAERGFPITATVDRSERGTVQAFAPSLAVTVGRNLSLGANFNVLNGRLHSNSLIRVAFGGVPFDVKLDVNFAYSGFVPDLGARWQMWDDRIVFAGAMTPGFTLKTRGGGFQQTSLIPQTSGAPNNAVGKVADHDYQIPAAYGVGLAVRPLDRLRLAADLNIHNWSQTKLKYVEAPEDYFSLASQTLPFRDVQTLSLGAEYDLMRRPWGSVPVRIGYRNAPQSVARIRGVGQDYDWIYYRTSQGVRDSLLQNNGLYGGEQIKANAYCFGFSLRLSNVSYDLGFETVKYDLERFFLSLPYDAIFNSSAYLSTLKRTSTRISLSANYRF